MICILIDHENGVKCLETHPPRNRKFPFLRFKFSSTCCSPLFVFLFLPPSLCKEERWWGSWVWSLRRGRRRSRPSGTNRVQRTWDPAVNQPRNVKNTSSEMFNVSELKCWRLMLTLCRRVFSSVLVCVWLPGSAVQRGSPMGRCCSFLFSAFITYFYFLLSLYSLFRFLLLLFWLCCFFWQACRCSFFCLFLLLLLCLHSYSCFSSA